MTACLSAPWWRRPASIAGLLACAALAACGGGDAGPAADDAAPTAHALAAGTTNTLELATTIAGFPHTIDVYRPAGATRAIVFLHGEGGGPGALATMLGFSKSARPSDKTVVWDWLSRNGVIAVLPQGQAASPTSPQTWSNYLFDSGQDDVAFLKALVNNVKARYGVASVALAGYSAGGMMAARMWCEAAGSYKAYVSVAGPMMSPNPKGTTCTPSVTAPYFVTLGAQDTLVPSFNPLLPPPTPEQAAAGLTAGFLVAEWTRHGDRSKLVCGETVALSGAASGGGANTWTNCGGRMAYSVVRNATHSLTSFETATGTKVVDMVAGFVF